MNRVLVSLLMVGVAAGAFAASSSLAPAAAPASSAALSAAASDVKVEKIAVGTAIDQRELTGAATEFPASVGRLYCWTKVSGAKPPVELKHVWYADGKKEAEVALTLQTESGRTWSSKSVWPGHWKVEVLGPSGSGELSSIEFDVK